MAKPVGWRNQPARHALASRGISTSRNEPAASSRPLSKAATKRGMHDEAITVLTANLPPGTKVYTTLTHVARSGMSRNIKVMIVKNGQLMDISYYVANAIDARQAPDGGVTVSGAGMDMGFHVVYSLGHRLYPKGFKAPPGYWRNEPLEWEPDGGYALKQEWI
mgnify:CR=1 FL=1